MRPFAAIRRAVANVTGVPKLRLEISERRLLLRVGDITLVLVSLLFALQLWARLADRPFGLALVLDQLSWVALIGLGWPIWLELTDMYALRRAARLAPTLRRVVIGGLLLAAAYILLFFITSRAAVTNVVPEALLTLSAQTEPLRFAPAVAIAGSTLLISAFRATYVIVFSGPHARRRLLIVGAGGAGKTLLRAIQKQHSVYYNIVGFIDDDPAKQQQSIDGVAVIGGHDRLIELAGSEQIDEIAVAISTELRGALFQAIVDCHERGVSIIPMPLLYEQIAGRIAVDHIGSQWYAALPFQYPAARTALAAIKRTIDIAAALLLLVILAMLLPALALCIRLDSIGPIFYRQERVGRRGAIFTLIKLRTMAADAERNGEARWAERNDSRVTRFGRLLRQTRLDELPQALNVLRGDMSLVGPRPERPQFVAQLERQIPYYRSRLAVRPGLTGWAQVNFGYGNSVEDSVVKLQYDLYYLKHQSPWFDLAILLRTVGVVLRMKGQ